MRSKRFAARLLTPAAGFCLASVFLLLASVQRAEALSCGGGSLDASLRRRDRNGFGERFVSMRA